jgi:hypothetical protein
VKISGPASDQIARTRALYYNPRGRQQAMQSADRLKDQYVFTAFGSHGG